LIAIIFEKGPLQIEAVNFYHPDAPFGTGHVDGITMLALWKEWKRKHPSKGMTKLAA